MCVCDASYEIAPHNTHDDEIFTIIVTSMSFITERDTKPVDYGCQFSYHLEIRALDRTAIITIENIFHHNFPLYTFDCFGCCLHFIPSMRMSHGRLTTIERDNKSPVVPLPCVFVLVSFIRDK